MNARMFCWVVLGAWVALSSRGQAASPPDRDAAAPARRPNVLLILPDQWRGQALGCVGDPDVRTPNIDRLAAGGALFRNTFANTPVCCPARAILLTGQYAHRNGMVANDLRLRESATTLAELLAAAGYRTGFIGKWHLDGGPRLPGFVPPGPRRQGFEYWAANECSHTHFAPVYFRDTPDPIKDKRFEPEAWTDRAIEFLRQSKGQPFFLEVAMGPPHDPYGAPEQYMKEYDPARITVRPNWVKGVTGAGRKEIAAYDAAIHAIDDQVGRLLQALRDLDLEDDTIVLFTSDHGDMLGSHGQRLKRKPWEESIRVPGIVRYPRRIKPNQRLDALFSHVDVAPTLLSLCGAKVPAAMQGTDVSPVLLGQKAEGPDSVFFQIFVPFAGDGTPNPWRGVRTAGAMYARTQDGPWVLYDLKQDPFEQTNRTADPARKALVAEMDAKVAAWMTRTGDSWDFDSMAPVEDKGRLYRFGTFYTIDEYLKWAAAHPDVAPRD